MEKPRIFLGSSGKQASLLDTLTRSVTPLIRSCRKTSGTPFMSCPGPRRFVAPLTNAT